MRRNQNFENFEKVTYVFRLFDFWNFIFAFPFSPFLFFLLQRLNFCWACLRFKTSKKASSRRAIFYHGVARCSGRKFGLSFSLNLLSIFVHISGSIRPITLICASLERFSVPAEVWCRWCQFWSKGMASEVEERPRFVQALYVPHGNQRVNAPKQNCMRNLERFWPSSLLSLIPSISVSCATQECDNVTTP